VIRVGSRRTYGFDSLSGSPLVSDDSASSANWRRVRGVPAGFLAWQRTGTRVLLAVGCDGPVRTSRDAGRSWRRVRDVGAEPTATTSHGGDFFVATTDGAVHVSSDGGRTWRIRVAPSE
jgi:photosystem II stability/assembly factor-like uncharacterized protein